MGDTAISFAPSASEHEMLSLTGIKIASPDLRRILTDRALAYHPVPTLLHRYRRTNVATLSSIPQPWAGICPQMTALRT